MNRFCEITFDKKINEDFLVDLVDSILKDLFHESYDFFLDNVLIDNYKYYFIFGGNMKYAKVLAKSIADYIQ